MAGAGSFAVGDAVHVFSLSKGRWYEDGVIREQAEEDGCGADGVAVPRGSLLVTYNGAAGVKWVSPQEQLQLLRSPSAPCFSPDASAQVSRFSQGDAVHVFSLSRGMWFEDGIVRERAEEDGCDDDGAAAPRGSLLVTYNGGAGVKWVSPQEQPQLLRSASAPSFSQDDSVQVFSLSQGRWFPDGIVRAVVLDDRLAEGGEVPLGALLVTYDGGAGKKWVMPWEQHEILRKASQAAEGARGVGCPGDEIPDEDCHLRGPHGEYLVAHEGGFLGMALDPPASPWELRRVGSRAGKRYLISQMGLYLAVADEGEQSYGLTREAGEHALWAVLHAASAAGKCFLQSSAGTHLASFDDDKQTLYMSPNRAGWETWTRISVKLLTEAPASAPASSSSPAASSSPRRDVDSAPAPANPAPASVQQSEACPEEERREREACAKDAGKLGWRLTSLGCGSCPSVVANDTSFEELRWIQISKPVENQKGLHEQMLCGSQAKWDTFLGQQCAERCEENVWQEAEDAEDE